MQIRNNYDNKDNYNSNTETILAHQSNIRYVFEEIYT